MMDITENIRAVKGRIEQACERTGRDPDGITLVAVSKTFPAERIIEAAECGITDIGENRVQDAYDKYRVVSDRVRWHFIGHLQTNKVKKVLEFADLIHSVDSRHLAEEIDRRAQAIGKTAEVLVEVNTTGEESKFGVGPDEAVEFVKGLSDLRNIRITGLMTIGIFSYNPEDARECYVRLRGLRDELTECDLPNGEMKYLSMGMSNDFEVAIEEGANIIRVGTAIFGQR